ncbi:somatostatin receptor type 5 isoform X2 [Drosophila yakuba]|uniref:somatostatin receptor type 5 isoform X2 n=1 Tax=Drosophila yakuba TaxID=7245 RepID=UPI0019307469|nr:somatostatin receptor type 5 isoform X2 [Drosophila yakuba]
MLQGVAITIANDSNDDGLNQSFMAHVSPSPNQSSSIGVGMGMGMGIASSTMPNPSESPELLLLKNDKFLTHVAHLLNITTENLSNLLGSTNGTNASTMAADSPVDESLTLRTAFTVCYALIFVAGVLGNLITCIVISRNNFMHTATNFYLFNLAVSDLILLVSGIPQELYNLWYPDMYPFTDAMCIMGSVLSEMAANATVLTITAFTVERYIAICHPFRQHTMSKLSRAIKFIFAIWLAAFLLALPQAMQFSVVYQNEGYSCTMENDFYAHVFAVSGFIFFCGPMTAICVLYVLIGVKLKRSRLLQSLPRRTFDANRGLNAQGRVIRMLAVAVAFFLCWAPFHAQRLMAVYGLNLINIGISRAAFNDYFRILDYTSGVLYFLSTCINPLLYNIMSHKFREAFKITLTRQFGLARNHHHQQSQHHQHNYSALLRQNGSMRLQPASCSVNNNALEPYGSYRVVQFRCRDASHQLSLQDSIRTTTTTTTINSNSMAAGNGVGGGGRRLRKQEFYGPVPGTAVPHRMLQAQVSQLSSLGDANSLLESDVVDRHYASGRAKRALLATKSGALLVTPTQSSDPAEVSQPATRLKLTRVISWRDEVANTSTPPFCGSHSLPDPETCQLTSVAGRGSRKFPWRKRRQKTEDPSSEGLTYGSPKSQ